MSGTLGKTAAVACLAGACASGSPQTRLTSPEAECPPGSVERLHAKGYRSGFMLSIEDFSLVNPDDDWVRRIPLPPEGPVTVYLTRDLPDRHLAKLLPHRTKFYGRLFHGQERFFVWLTEAETPAGERMPVCLQVGWQGDFSEPVQVGMHYHKSSTPEQKVIDTTLQMFATDHLGRL